MVMVESCASRCAIPGKGGPDLKGRNANAGGPERPAGAGGVDRSVRVETANVS